MHEMSLAQGIVEMVERTAQHEHFSRVTQLHLQVGALAGVEVQALRFALDSMSHEGVLQGVTVLIDTPKATAWCLHCSNAVEITARGQACPLCASYQIQPTSGTELKVVDMIVI